MNNYVDQYVIEPPVLDILKQHSVRLPNNVVVEIQNSSLSPKAIWESRGYWSQLVDESKEIWKAMDQESKTALVNRVTKALDHLNKTAAEWISEAISKAENGTVVDFRIIFTDIAEEKHLVDGKLVDADA